MIRLLPFALVAFVLVSHPFPGCQGALEVGTCTNLGERTYSCEQRCNADGSCSTSFSTTDCDCSGFSQSTTNQREAWDVEGNFLGIVGRRRRQASDGGLKCPQTSCRLACDYSKKWKKEELDCSSQSGSFVKQEMSGWSFGVHFELRCQGKASGQINTHQFRSTNDEDVYLEAVDEKRPASIVVAYEYVGSRYVGKISVCDGDNVASCLAGVDKPADNLISTFLLDGRGNLKRAATGSNGPTGCTVICPSTSNSPGSSCEEAAFEKAESLLELQSLEFSLYRLVSKFYRK